MSRNLEVSTYLLQGFVLLTLIQFYEVQGVSAPYRVTYSIYTDSIEVRWKHSVRDEPNGGYYIAVQEVRSGQKQGRPEFVHAEEGARKAIIRGLKPYALYKIKVIAYTDEDHEASSPVLVKTDTLKFLQAYDPAAMDVTSDSVVVEWKHDPEKNVHDVQFRVVCSGLQVFHRNGQLMEEVTGFKHTMPCTSHPTQSYIIQNLTPNTHYTCDVLSVAGNRVGKPQPGSAFEFTTAPGKPSLPPRPRIHLTKEHDQELSTSFTIDLYPTDDQFGHVDHYKVFAVPVYRADGQPMTAPYKPKVLPNHLLTQAVSSHLVSQVDEAIPFIIGEYDAKSLPETLTFDGHWMKKAFKPDTHYSVVVAAFTATKGSKEELYTVSDLADPPVFIGPDMQKQWVQERKPAVKRFTVTVLATLFSVVGLFTVAFLVAFGSSYYRAKKRDAHFFSVVDSSDSSEDEIYSKMPQKPMVVKPLPPRVPETPLADWAVENVRPNPAFDTMVYRSPDTLKEMDDTLNHIAQKHARRIQAMKDETRGDEQMAGAEMKHTDDLTQVSPGENGAVAEPKEIDSNSTENGALAGLQKVDLNNTVDGGQAGVQKTNLNNTDQACMKPSTPPTWSCSLQAMSRRRSSPNLPLPSPRPCRRSSHHSSRTTKQKRAATEPGTPRPYPSSPTGISATSSYYYDAQEEDAN